MCESEHATNGTQLLGVSNAHSFHCRAHRCMTKGELLELGKDVDRTKMCQQIYGVRLDPQINIPAWMFCLSWCANCELRVTQTR